MNNEEDESEWISEEEEELLSEEEEESLEEEVEVLSYEEEGIYIMKMFTSYFTSGNIQMPRHHVLYRKLFSL